MVCQVKHSFHFSFVKTKMSLSPTPSRHAWHKSRFHCSWSICRQAPRTACGKRPWSWYMHVCGLHCGQLAAVAFFYAGFGLAFTLSHRCCPQCNPHTCMWNHRRQPFAASCAAIAVGKRPASEGFIPLVSFHCVSPSFKRFPLYMGQAHWGH